MLKKPTYTTYHHTAGPSERHEGPLVTVSEIRVDAGKHLRQDLPGSSTDVEPSLAGNE